MLSGHIELNSRKYENSEMLNPNCTYGSAIPEINDDSLGITFGGADGFPVEIDQSKYIKHYAVLGEPSAAGNVKPLFKNDFSENMLLHSYNWPKDAPPESEAAANKTRLKQ